MKRTAINRNSPDKWKQDIIQSVDLYNSWFMEFAPKAFRETRLATAERVEHALKATDNLLNINCELLKKHPEVLPILRMEAGTYSFRINIPVLLSGNDTTTQINIPVDVAIMPIKSNDGDLPLFIEAKSAGDFTNVNKRRKEEAQKMAQLRNTYGDDVKFGLFLCGYFDSGYLGYEAAEGIDWIWEHRIEDLALYEI